MSENEIPRGGDTRDAKTKWEEKVAETKQLANQIWEEVEKLIDSGVLPQNFDWVDYINRIITPELKKQTGIDNLHQYVAYHSLIFSGTIFETHPEVDLPGDLIVNFMKELLAKLQHAKEINKFELGYSV